MTYNVFSGTLNPTHLLTGRSKPAPSAEFAVEYFSAENLAEKVGYRNHSYMYIQNQRCDETACRAIFQRTKTPTAVFLTYLIF